MLPRRSSGVTLAPAEMLTIFTFRPAWRKRPSRCATYTPAEEAVGTAAITRLVFPGPLEDAVISAVPDAHPAAMIAASATIAAHARRGRARGKLDRGGNTKR